MKLTKKQREEAVEALLCLADTNIPPRFPGLTTSSLDTGVDRVCERAWRAVVDAVGFMALDLHEDYLEAAALLEEGWNPGDPVERLS